MKSFLFLSIVICFLFSTCTNENDPKPLRLPIDYEGYEYDTIQIGSQVWMSENLKTEFYLNGDIIPTTSNPSIDISGLPDPKYQWAYAGNENFEDIYGRLYTWYVITDPRGICPAGWRVPDNQDWNILVDFLGGSINAGDKLKEIGNTHWHLPNDGATNETGFNALPGGFRRPNGDFMMIGYHGRWWSTTEASIENAWRMGVANDRNETGLYNYYKSEGFSVRCLKN